MVEFHKANSDFELLDILRLRYQMFANDIRTLSGILLGYSLSRPKDYVSSIPEFSAYLSKRNKVNPHAVSWVEQVIKEANNPQYEIPTFFTLLDQYRNTVHEEIAGVELTCEQRHFDFHRCLENVNMDYPEIPLKPPHTLKAIRISGAKVHVFYIDESNVKYYEQCLGDMEYVKRWAKDCFSIEPTQW